ncbi:hypothetical protein ABW20_dc0100881 [Dactylellina cionopaga]|nr:hypothetical protein ABW20_dc0100881 [Dactylellina cionopaga]
MPPKRKTATKAASIPVERAKTPNSRVTRKSALAETPVKKKAVVVAKTPKKTPAKTSAKAAAKTPTKDPTEMNTVEAVKTPNTRANARKSLPQPLVEDNEEIEALDNEKPKPPKKIIAKSKAKKAVSKSPEESQDELEVDEEPSEERGLNGVFARARGLRASGKKYPSDKMKVTSRYAQRRLTFGLLTATEKRKADDSEDEEEEKVIKKPKIVAAGEDDDKVEGGSDNEAEIPDLEDCFLSPSPISKLPAKSKAKAKERNKSAKARVSRRTAVELLLIEVARNITLRNLPKQNKTLRSGKRWFPRNKGPKV